MKFDGGLILGKCGCVVAVDKHGDCDILQGCVGHKSQLFTNALNKRLEKYEAT